MAKVRLTGIDKTFGDGPKVLTGVNLKIEDGEFVVFVGPSGCGKSTLLQIIAGLEEATGGEVYIGDELANDVPPASGGRQWVFQSYALYPHMTVSQNMGFSLKLAGRPKEEIKAAVARAAEILQISHLLERTPRQLSGGQRQRVAIGRAIVRKPKVFLQPLRGRVSRVPQDELPLRKDGGAGRERARAQGGRGGTGRRPGRPEERHPRRAAHPRAPPRAPPPLQAGGGAARPGRPHRGAGRLHRGLRELSGTKQIVAAKLQGHQRNGLKSGDPLGVRPIPGTSNLFDAGGKALAL